MPYRRNPSQAEQGAAAAAMAVRVYPLICTVRAALAVHTMGTPVECTSNMRIIRPGPANDTFNVDACAVMFYRPALATDDEQSRYFLNVDRQGDTLGMECMGAQVYGPIPLHPEVTYLSFFSHIGTEDIRGGFVVPLAHNSMTF